MATDTFGVIGIDITPHGGFCFLDAENSILGTVNDAVITLKAHTTAHAAVGFQLRFLLREALDTFAK
jgi:hypothetical protein